MGRLGGTQQRSWLVERATSRSEICDDYDIDFVIYVHVRYCVPLLHAKHFQMRPDLVLQLHHHIHYPNLRSISQILSVRPLVRRWEK